ncbi:MAG: HSP90 family protein [Clostridia bacterium]|nr:HSP90 family protein [Clostridia bacterium]
MNNDYKFKVNLGGMIDILSNHLYSSPNVFVRELLQNGIDAISARIFSDNGFDSSDAKIEIEVVKGEKIIFRDNGTGLNEEEIHQFLSVIGQSSKYDIENNRSNGDFIGRFGIGLLSCFMATDSICVRTSSFKNPGTALEWRGMADGTYTIHQISENIPVGTEIILENNKKEKDSELIDDYYTSESISNLVYYYGLFLKYPVYVIDGGEKTRLNLKFDFDTKKNKDVCMQLGKTFLGEEFLDCFTLTSQTGLFNGIAYVLPYPVAANVHNMHRIYLKNMLLTESGEKLLPEWAFFIRCIINTDHLKPTSSREDFYEDEDLEKARNEIAGCIADYFEELDLHNNELLYKIVSIHNLAVKSVLSSSEGMDDILLPYILFETSLGELSGRDISEFGGTAFYTLDVNQFKQLAPLYTQRSELLINAGYVYEGTILQKLAETSRKTDIEKLTESDIDFMLDDSEFDGDPDAERLLSLAAKILKKYDCKASIKEFRPFDIPALYTINEKAYEARQIRRSKENANAVFTDMLSSFEDEINSKAIACLYFNTNNLIIRKLIDCKDKDKISCYIEILYVQSLLSGHFPLLNNEMKVLNENLYKLMEF